MLERRSYWFDTETCMIFHDKLHADNRDFAVPVTREEAFKEVFAERRHEKYTMCRRYRYYIFPRELYDQFRQIGLDFDEAIPDNRRWIVLATKSGAMYTRNIELFIAPDNTVYATDRSLLKVVPFSDLMLSYKIVDKF